MRDKTWTLMNKDGNPHESSVPGILDVERSEMSTRGEFASITSLPSPELDEEWMVTLSDKTEVVVLGTNDAPCQLSIAKATAIVQSRSYLKQRALQLLAYFDIGPEQCELVTIDFGKQARRHRCEFLMCFLCAPVSQDPSDSPYVEVGFELPDGQGPDPVFRLTIRTMWGLTDEGTQP
jgi:hypothetical protein